MDMGNLKSDQKLRDECDEIEKGEGKGGRTLQRCARLLCVLLTLAAAYILPHAHAPCSSHERHL